MSNRDELIPDDPSGCNCGPGWRRPKPNGTCATCGGWLPGERPPSLTELWGDIKRGAEQIKRHEMEIREDDQR